MVSTKVLPIFLSLFALASAQLDATNNLIDYSVVKLLNDTDIMGVMVDNVTYPLHYKDSVTKILHTGKAPVAKQGYHYVKITKSNNNTEMESFLRSPTSENTVNEFYNRSWNKRDLPQLPVLYQPFSEINRIKTNLHIDGQIPTIHFMGNQTQFNLMHNSNMTEDIGVSGVNMTYINLNETLHYQGIEISLAGRSSRWMPKLSYNVKLDKKDKLYDFARVKLRALDTDPSYLRESLAYNIIENVGLLSSRFSYVRVLLNDQELGLFGIIETFQDPWLANSFAHGSSSYKNSNLYQGIFTTPQSSAVNHTSDLSYYKDNLTAYEDGQYKIKVQASGSGKQDDFQPLMKLTGFIDSAPTNGSDVVKEWNKHLNTDAFLRAMALEVLLGYSDGYLTMADNYYMYQNSGADDRFFYIPSDMDLTFGSAMFNLTDMWSGNVATYPGFKIRPLISKMMQVPEFKQQYDGLLVNITQQLVNPVHMNDRINGLVDMLQEDIEWDGSLARVAKNIMASLAATMGSNSTGNGGISAIIGNIMLEGINMNLQTVGDFAARMNETVSLEDAVNGPTGHISLAGIKEWIQKESDAILKFYNASSQ